MKSKISIFWILILSVFIFSNFAAAESAIIKDITVDTQGSSVKISITSNQTLQIETFKNDESPANYIVLDFLGTVYTNLPSIIEVTDGPVEKVSLVRGDDEKVTITGKEYYSLDFLAINLNKAADYNIKQSKAVIDLNIGTAASLEMAAREQRAVELTPPIVVSKAKETPAPTTYSKSDYSSSSMDTYKPKTSMAEEKSYASSETLRSRKPVGKKKASVKAKRKKVSRSSKRILGKRKSRGERKKKQPVPEKVSVPERKPEPVVRAKPRPLPALRSRESDYLIDRIVNETIRDKESVASRIEDLTYELKKLQEELYLSKGEKSKVEQKINEILAKLDQLQNALDEEIRRRQALGQKVDDLLAKRESYIKAKRIYEELKAKLARITDEVQNMTEEFKGMKLKLDELQIERKKIAGEVSVMGKEYTQSKTEYERVISVREAISIKVDKLTRELEQLRRDLDLQVAEKKQISAQLKSYEERSKYSGMELARLQQLLDQKDAMLRDLTGRYDQMKVALDAVVAEKFKVEFSYRNARTEFDKIKAEIEGFLDRSNIK